MNDVDVRSSVWVPGTEVFPGCTVLESLASGGFGEVWKAKSDKIGLIALKRIPLSDPIRNESRALDAMKGISHPHLANVHGHWRSETLLVVALELGDQSLEDRFEECRARGMVGLPLDELVPWMVQIGSALDFLYQDRKMLHRDVKPSNLLLIGDVAKVCDFGLAKVLEDRVDRHSGVASFDYAPPEFFDGQATPSSDQFSLAATYCYLLSGHRPFPGPSIRQLMMQHLQGAPDLAAMPTAQEPALRRALARNVEDRFPSCSAMVAALADAVGMGS